MKKDISNKEDIKFLVDEFYSLVLKDDLISSFFTEEIIGKKLEDHLPTMYDFWNSVLFAEVGYAGNPMQKHIALSEKQKLYKLHFQRWLYLWHKTVDNLFEGDKAEMAKAMADVMGKSIGERVQNQSKLK